MTIPSKGSRRIVVDETAYRWTVRRKPTYAQGLTDSPLSFAVENEAAPGTTLVVLADGPRPDNWVEPAGKPVTPAIVERAIRAALAQGWRPSDKGGAFEISLVVN
jgi:hypothetical protein